MKQEVNYIKHHKNVNLKISQITTMKITSTDISLYNALFLIWNECGFETELSINRNDVMMLSKIGSANTYTKSLKKLDKLGFIKYKPSYNPLIGSKIQIYRFDNGCDNGTDKGSVKSSSKGIDKGSDTLYKLLNKETIKLLNNKEVCDIVNYNLSKWLSDFKKDSKTQNIVAEIYPTFDDFWDLYDKKTSKSKSEKKWLKLKQEEKEKIMDHIPLYKISKPEKQYRKDPITYLNNKSWEDEIILPNKLSNPIKINRQTESVIKDNLSGW